MNSETAMLAFSALAQSTRLEAFRMLVRQDPKVSLPATSRASFAYPKTRFRHISQSWFAPAWSAASARAARFFIGRNSIRYESFRCSF